MTTLNKREFAQIVIKEMPIGKWISLEDLVKKAAYGRLYSIRKSAMARFLLEHKSRIERKVSNRVSFYRRTEK